MNFKIDTKEKFNEIAILEPVLSANMTEGISELLDGFAEKDVKSIVLSFEAVQEIDIATAEEIAKIQQRFYEIPASFVIWGLQPAVEKMLDDAELLEQMNVTPTLSEAWDIVQMEEIERELLGDF